MPFDLITTSWLACRAIVAFRIFQFHVAFDDMFETVRKKSGNPQHSLWQTVTGFKEPPAQQGAPAPLSTLGTGASDGNRLGSRPPTRTNVDSIVRTSGDQASPLFDPIDQDSRDVTGDGVSHDRGTPQDRPVK